MNSTRWIDAPGGRASGQAAEFLSLSSSYSRSAQHPSTRSLTSRAGLALRLLPALFATAVLVAPSFAQAAMVGLREVGTGATQIIAGEGDSVSLELYLDTEGLSFEGYMLGIDISGGGVSGLSVSHQSLSGLFPDLFGVHVIDEVADSIRTINQITFTTGLQAGVHSLNIITFTVDQYDSSSMPEILVSAGLFGESLGLGGDACPSGGCAVSFSPATIVPEPATALTLGLGLAGLAIARRWQPRV